MNSAHSWHSVSRALGELKCELRVLFSHIVVCHSEHTEL